MRVREEPKQEAIHRVCARVRPWAHEHFSVRGVSGWRGREVGTRREAFRGPRLHSGRCSDPTGPSLLLPGNHSTQVAHRESAGCGLRQHRETRGNRLPRWGLPSLGSSSDPWGALPIRENGASPFFSFSEQPALPGSCVTTVGQPALRPPGNEVTAGWITPLQAWPAGICDIRRYSGLAGGREEGLFVRVVGLRPGPWTGVNYAGKGPPRVL